MTYVSQDHYNEYWHVFEQKNHHRIILESNKIGRILKEKNACDSIKSMLSVGHGEGKKDIILIEDYLKNLENYYGVEPREAAVEVVKKALNKLPNRKYPIKTYIQTDFFQAYEGPGQQVDLIFINHTMYYLVDEFKEVIDKALTWLAPGGYLILNHNNAGASEFLKQGAEVLKNDLLLRFVAKKNECEQHLKTVGWTVEDYPYQISVDYSGSDYEMQQLLRLQFDTDISDRQVILMKPIIQKLAKKGSKGFIDMDYMATIIYKS